MSRIREKTARPQSPSTDKQAGTTEQAHRRGEDAPSPFPASKSGPERSAFRPVSLIIASVFFFTGLCGLIYGTVWTRLLALVFGNTAQAVSTVSGVFMFGLALGSHFVGRRLRRIQNPQRFLGLVEVGIGVYAFFFLPLLYPLQQIHSALFPYLYDHQALPGLFRILLTVCVISVPAVLMGAAVPLAASALRGSQRSVGRDAGTIYFLGASGAALGSFLSAFVLIPHLGLQWMLCLGGLLNVTIGIVTLAVKHAPAAPEPTKNTATETGDDRPEQFWALFAIGLIGFLSMVCVISWRRALIMVFGPSVYPLALTVTVYLLGLALGGFVFRRFADKIKNRLEWLSALTAAAGLSIFAGALLTGSLPNLFVRAFAHDNANWARITLLEFLVSFAIMLPAAFCTGASFPLVSRILERKSQPGRSIADAFALSIGGWTIGLPAAGFVLVPVIGAERSLIAAGAASILLAAALMILPLRQGTAKSRGLRAAIAVLLAVTAIAGSWIMPNRDARATTAGVYLYSQAIAKTQSSVADFMTRYHMLLYREDPNGTVAVLESSTGSRFLRVNGMTDGSDGGDRFTQVLLALAPVFYSSSPQTALDIGLGTGMTAGSLLDYPFETIDCAEISPAVVEASRFFSKSAGDVLQSPRLHLHILDGRTWLQSTDRKYDIVTSTSSHPWQTGNANLFTVEFFELAKKRMTGNGILCQWLPFYNTDKQHFRLVLGSLKTVFRFVNVWIDNTDAILIASDRPLVLDYEGISQKMQIEGVKKRLQTIGIETPEDLLGLFYIDDEAVNGFIGNVEALNSDIFPIVEFNAPKRIIGPIRPDAFSQLMELSYRSRPHLINCDNPAETNRQRIQQRARFYREWFPERIANEIMRKSLQANR